jgi:hypothetical protein
MREKIKKCNFYVNKMTNFVFFISFQEMETLQRELGECEKKSPTNELMMMTMRRNY